MKEIRDYEPRLVEAERRGSVLADASAHIPPLAQQTQAQLTSLRQSHQALLQNASQIQVGFVANASHVL